MAGVYPFPEWDDIVYGYLEQVWAETDGPATPRAVRAAMEEDFPGTVDIFAVHEAFASLRARGLMRYTVKGDVPLRGGAALWRQLDMEEVEPFTREYGETPEAHEDKVWDFRTALTKPGGKKGLLPIAQYHMPVEERVWTGLTQREEE